MKLRFPLLFICFFLIVSLSSAQNIPPKLIEITPPSPSAAALTKFGNIPVGLSTGLPQVNIPIYTYEGIGNGLSLSTSLDYHSGGIKVSEVASNVGLGWALNVGGVVTRMVRGIPDETTNGFLNTTIPVNEGAGNLPMDYTFRPFNNIHAGVRDGQNDIFSYNFNGRSGQFVLGRNNDILFNSSEKLKVTRQTSSISGNTLISKITIVDENGFTYVFGAYEVMTTMGGVWTGSKHSTTAWYLTEMVAPNGIDKILLEYDNTGINDYIFGMSHTRYTRANLTYGEISGSSSSSQSVQGKRLRKVTFPNGVRMDFTYSTSQRTDLPGDYLLKKIVITDGKHKRGFTLTQDYSLLRAALKSVIPFQGAAETPQKPYNLSYFTSGTWLPNRETSIPDHWGYFKGNNVGGWFPREIFPGGLGAKFEWGGSNRDTDPTYVKVGSLQKITYPTGGYTIFEMEANRANHSWLDKEFAVGGVTYTHKQNYVGGLRAKKVSDYDGVSSTAVQVKEYEYVLADGVTSSGALGIYPTYSFSIFYDYHNPILNGPDDGVYRRTLEYVVRSSSSVYEMVYSGGSPVTYERVVEKQTSGGTSNGKTVSFFAVNQVSMASRLPLVPPDQKIWSSGLLKQEWIYNSSNTLIKKTVNVYKQTLDNYWSNPIRAENFRSITIMPVKFRIPQGSADNNFTPFGNPLYFIMNSYLPPSGKAQLVRSIEYTYEPTGTYQRAIGYTYDPNNFYKKTDTLTDSRNAKQINRYLYPQDMVSAGRDPSGIYQGMVNKNIINPVIEQVHLKNATQLSLVRTNYYQPFTGIYVPQTVITKKGAAAEKTQFRYQKYNSKGRIITSAIDGGPPRSYIWGHVDQYPIAVIENGNAGLVYHQDFEESSDFESNVFRDASRSHTGKYAGRLINSGVPESISLSTRYLTVEANGPRKFTYSGWVYSTGPKTQIHLFMYKAGETGYFTYVDASGSAVANKWTYISKTFTLPADVVKMRLRVDNDGTGTVWFDDLRIQPSDAAMSTYTYEPAVGITSSINPQGKATYYEYDSFQRLIGIKDLNGHYIERYNYHYKTP